MATERIHTYCAMCVSRCGVAATVEDGLGMYMRRWVGSGIEDVRRRGKTAAPKDRRFDI